MSVFELPCAEAASGGVVCAHIHKFYPNIVGTPVVFYVINDDELPAAHNIIPYPSDTGDECHRDIDATNNSLYKAFKAKRDWGNFMTCDAGQIRAMTAEDTSAIVAARAAPEEAEK